MTTADTAPGGNPTFGRKATLLYGGGKGIGRAVAAEFARRGARLAIADIDRDAAEESAQQVIAAGGEAVALRCDVMSDASVRETAVAAEIALGEIDIVMNNVGGMLHGLPQDIPLSEWQRIHDLNLMPVARSNAVFLPRMIARGSGFIVNTASFAGLYPFAITRMPYVAAKAGVVAVSQSMAIYLQPLGVRVACLCPGPIMTEVLDSMRTWSANVEMRGPGSHLALKTPADVAKTLADGMEGGRIIIPTHEEAFATLREHAANPDAYIRKVIDQFASGDYGRPKVTPELLAALRAQG